MRAMEQAAIDSGEVTGLELMERAGRGVVDAVLAWRPELATTSHRAVVLCGPGNNGGDGFVIARLLKQRGWEVEVYLYGNEAKLPPDAAENARRWREVSGTVRPWQNEWSFETPPLRHSVLGSQALYVDALFGSGLTRNLSEDDFGDLCGHLQESNRDVVQIVSVDCPSGLCLDSGRVLHSGSGPTLPAYIEADLTVTFHAPKSGHRLADGPRICHRVVVREIGLKKSCLGQDSKRPRLVDKRSRWRLDYRHSSSLAKADLRQPSLARDLRNKYDHGHSIVLTGGVGRGGAARLAARGALRIGAGLVTVGCPPAALIENACRLDAVMLRAVKGVDGLQELLSDTRITALCLGPGFGVGEACREMVAAALAAASERSRIKSGTPSRLGLVLDADALTSFADGPEALFEHLTPDCVLTPHEGEFGRLFPDILEELRAPALKGPAYSKVDAAREAAARAGCVVLFKGADTVIADPSGRCAINSAHYERSAPWLATAGSGDVLAGFITGLLARGLGAMEAAETAAWLHVECALKFGPGLIAEDLPEQLPAVFRDLGL
ncbi:MAG: NAD(P)H-hydrate dehydratase [Pseudomonadota bacterium]